MKKNLLAVAVLSSLSLSAFAGGYQAGDMVLRGGLVNVQPDSAEFTILAGGAPVDIGLGNLMASVEDDTQVSLNFVYFLDSNWAVEVLAATPFSHDITVNLGDGTKTNLGETKHLPPTVSALYYFDTNSNFKPYVGAGINYTFFFEDDFNPAMEGPDSPLNLSDLNLTNSWGLSAQIGVDYYFNENWSINASARYIDIDTTAKFQALGGTVPGYVDVDIDPMVYSLQVGYKF
ncbi:OmpW/AlkL family protein [Thalassotalea eurytherma]|uniref:Outer membrane protein OmpW n=1 Tax=Thalassotalea eurytherma TaxID=1144278 RepID=A0ABQ6H168_9GAMM|nr:OmpW family outer membrane protein [Thalassotalea eurytherma]GLX80552.1 outer membrane protein OmpW [Thalassotalea eurytherma]